MDEAGVKLLMSLCYRAGIKDGWDGKELPTLKQLDNMVDEIYHNYKRLLKINEKVKKMRG